MIFEEINNFPLYWENGMKLSADHFQHLEKSIEDSMRDGRSFSILSQGSYGLLPNSLYSIQNAEGQGSQSVKVVLNACRAILPGGYRVEILPENIQKLQIPNQAPSVEFVPKSGARYNIYITVDESNMIPAGIPQTRPIRQPYLCPDYRLECVPQEKTGTVRKTTGAMMKIAEWQDGKVVEGYIPPTLCITGFPILEKWFGYFQNQLENMVRMSAHVIHGNRKSNEAKVEFCTQIVGFLRSSQGYFRWKLPHESPVSLAVYFGNLAGLVSGLIETLDRDFVRTSLKNGDLANLNITLKELLMFQSIPQEDIALVISKIQKFISALMAVIQSLETKNAPAPRSGDRKITSG